MKYSYGIGTKIVLGLNVVWTITVALIFLAPYLASIDSPLSGIIYLLFKPTCHQMAHRSFFLWGHQFAVCARCTGIWTSLMFFGYIATILLFLKKLRPLNLIWFAVALIPLAIDGATQLTGFRESTNLLRSITGSITGAAIIWFTYPRIWVADEDWGAQKNKRFSVPRNERQ
ncbi:DUF2085 domain-containing protein [bacterium]|nr:MAG: DUF2085 domain-containing protein [bacterium]